VTNFELKRRWFQIHLSTAVVLMITAGVLVWMNLRVSFNGHMSEIDINSHGWPCEAIYVLWEARNVGISQDIPEASQYISWSVVDLTHVGIDTFVALAILAAVAVTLEWWIRRRDARE